MIVNVRNSFTWSPIEQILQIHSTNPSGEEGKAEKINDLLFFNFNDLDFFINSPPIFIRSISGKVFFNYFPFVFNARAFMCWGLIAMWLCLLHHLISNWNYKLSKWFFNKSRRRSSFWEGVWRGEEVESFICDEKYGLKVESHTTMLLEWDFGAQDSMKDDETWVNAISDSVILAHDDSTKAFKLKISWRAIHNTEISGKNRLRNWLCRRFSSSISVRGENSHFSV